MKDRRVGHLVHQGAFSATGKGREQQGVGWAATPDGVAKAGFLRGVWQSDGALGWEEGHRRAASGWRKTGRGGWGGTARRTGFSESRGRPLGFEQRVTKLSC